MTHYILIILFGAITIAVVLGISLLLAIAIDTCRCLWRKRHTVYPSADERTNLQLTKKH